MTDNGHSKDGTDFAHPLPLPLLFGVFIALVLLTIITVAQTNLDLGSIDIVIVMGIATLKAILVGAFFMHLLYDKPFNIIVFLASFVFVGLFIIITLADSSQTSPAFDHKIDEPIPTIVAE